MRGAALTVRCEAVSCKRAVGRELQERSRTCKHKERVIKLKEEEDSDPSRLVKGELILDGALGSVEGCFGDRAPA